MLQERLTATKTKCALQKELLILLFWSTLVLNLGFNKKESINVFFIVFCLKGFTLKKRQSLMTWEVMEDGIPLCESQCRMTYLCCLTQCVNRFHSFQTMHI